jgi:hypothetical protein
MEDMITGVRAALAGRQEADPRDAAAEALALRYAGLMDNAAPAAKYRRHMEVLSRAIAGTSLDEDDPYEAFQVVATALSEHSVASDLGPKLLAALTGLGLTTAARGGLTGGGGAQSAGVTDPLDQIRQARERRRLGARIPG